MKGDNGGMLELLREMVRGGCLGGVTVVGCPCRQV
jgi:hypothetical protein